ncbi:MAG: class IV adenylate cyclase [Rhodothermales bacterium]|nr:class IV adenylate cyclase [Rhodothermales bacterium]
MPALRNVEIKAKCPDPGAVRNKLDEAGATYVGLDQQRDTYFRAPGGRLKLREGTIENSLIAYRRGDKVGPKLSTVALYKGEKMADLRGVLLAALPLDVIVEKSRHIYYLDDAKIHVDSVPTLGHFVEIEVIDADGDRDTAELDQRCRQLMALLGVKSDHLVSASYSDLLRSTGTRPAWHF